MFGCKVLAGFNFIASFVYLFFNYYGGSSNALVSTDSIDTAASGSFWDYYQLSLLQLFYRFIM